MTHMREETVVVGKDGKYPLEGVLTLPDAPLEAAPGEAPGAAQGAAQDEAQDAAIDPARPQSGGRALEAYPAVLLVHGSGRLNRDEKMGVLTPFKDIAHYLAEQGIASLRYDKRSFVYGKQLKKEFMCPTVMEETIEDALLAAELLRADARIDAARVFIAGHSLGGMLAPRIDAMGGDFAGLIILAGSPRRLLDIIVDQNEAVIAGLKGFIKLVAALQVAAFYRKLAVYDTWSLEESKSKKFIGVNAYYLKEMEAHPARDYLMAMTKPLLVLQGGKDFQVSAGRDFTSYQTVFLYKDNARFCLYPELGHAFTPAVYGEITKVKKEYAQPATVDERVLEDIRAFVLGEDSAPEGAQ